MNGIYFNERKITPSKIVCVGMNYAAHNEEMGNRAQEEPVFFMKSNASISDTLRTGAPDEIHYEGEISFVVRGGALAGVGFGFDLTRRNVQSRLRDKGLPWERSKAFRGAAVFGPFVPFSGNVENLRVELTADGAVAQAGGYAQMLVKPRELFDDAASFIDWEDGDMLMTGTPAGVGPLVEGVRYRGTVYDGDAVLTGGEWVAE